ncbi:MAG: hypothetical protein HYY37_04855 [Candidatus Aenigmarchaeota archaeon]|nr:hypothetical protein [Candidatus Aenigmarchaeota archaeon]
MPNSDMGGYAHHKPRGVSRAFVLKAVADEKLGTCDGVLSEITVYDIGRLPKGSYTAAPEGSPEYRALQNDPAYREVIILPPR